MANVGSDSSPSDLLGEDFGPYRLVRRLGVGGMAQTFEAVRHGPSGFSQRVCLKLVLPFLRDNQAFAELFKQEARLAAKLRHSNIVGVIDFGEIDGTLYMALELVDGVDLQVLLAAQDRKRVSADCVTLLGRDVARALEHAHNPRFGTAVDGSDLRAIIHRDISPSNVLISRHGEVMLADFGVAKAITDTWAKQSNVKGKIPYMAPEQLMGEPLDGRADLFALGVVLFEALTGKHPHAAVNEPATIMAALAGNHLPLAELAPDAPLGLREVIESLLESDRDKRPATASALAELLDELAPSPGTRRALGKMVAQMPTTDARRVESGVGHSAGGAGPREEPGLAEAPTAPSVRTPEPVTPVPTSTRWSRRDLAKKTAWAILALAGVSAGALALWPDQQRDAEPPEDAHNEAEPESIDVAVGEPPLTDVDDADDATAGANESEESDSTEGQANDAPARPDPSTARRAQLTVAVFPFGEVWINGKAQGTAPLKNQVLKPGVYRISAGQGSPTKTQKIRLRPGQTKTVIFDLSAPDR